MMGGRLLGLACAALFGLGLAQARAGLLDRPTDPGGLCSAAVQAAETRYTLPAGLLYAISQVESGRPVASGGRQPWPWTVQAENRSHYFATKAQAVLWVRKAEAQGVTSIDVGCMQVNLMYHPSAFADLDAAFDPDRNADYAARFLTALHAQTGDWKQAAGRYHSETLALAIPYRRQVEAMLQTGGNPGLSPAALRLRELQEAWDATLNGDGRSVAAPALSGNWAGLLAAETRPKRARSARPREIMLSDAR